MPIFKPKFYFYEILKTDMAKNPEGAMPLNSFIRYLNIKTNDLTLPPKILFYTIEK